MGLKKSLFYSLFILLQLNSFGQQQSERLNDLSPQQIAQLVSKYDLDKLSEPELEAKAKELGLSLTQIELLKERMSQNYGLGTKNHKKNTNQNKRDNPKLKNTFTEKDTSVAFPIFGADIFSNQRLSFEPDLAISTPQNYVIGTNDQLIVDIFGVSDLQQKLIVSPEGFVRFPNFGPIKVAGLSIETARTMIKQLLTRIYPGLSNGTVGIQVSIGQIRTIRVTLIGEIQRPGNYNISSLSTLMNALYASGGPSKNGSFRKIDLVRNGKSIISFDLYDFLLKGDLSKNWLLQDGDVIRVGTYQNRVALKGAVKKQALFDVKEGESAEDILNYAGGFADMAIRNSLTIIRNGITRKEVLTLETGQLKITKLLSGDTLLVDSIRSSFKNRIVVGGAVEHPGIYGVEQVKDLQSLITLVIPSENAFRQRAVVKRYAGNQPSIIGFNLDEVTNNQFNLPLQSDDSVQVYKQSELQESYKVFIEGEVNKTGPFAYFKGLRIVDLVMMAGGLKDGASKLQMEVSRRIRNDVSSNDTIRYAIIKTVSLDTANFNKETALDLEPFDMVFVRRSPVYKPQVNITLEGEVMYPGKYSLSAGTDKLSDLITRAGGLRKTASMEGASLLRKSKIGFELSDTAWLKQQLLGFEKKQRITDGLNNLELPKESTDSSGVELQELLTDSSSKTWYPSRLKPVGIHLEKAMSAPGSLEDVVLQDGDVLTVPSTLTTIQVMGAVQVTKQMLYEPGLSVRSAIQRAGGLVAEANLRKAYVVYANGEVKSTRKTIFFRNYPRLDPGAELHIPFKTQEKGLTTGEAIGLISGLSSIISLLIFVLR
jgi:protein involved in polysaccharide export with SLBB domain